MKTRFSALTLCAGLMATLTLTTTQTIASDEVNVYSYRQPFLIEPLFDQFTESTGIKVNTVFSKKGLVERLKIEGENSPADLLLTSDFGNLRAAIDADVLQAVDSDTLTNNIQAEFRDPNNKWFGLTNRARLIAVSKERLANGGPESYEDLANPEYKGKICTRSGKHNYMSTLIASVIAHNGDADARAWLQGVKANLARKPQGNDRAQVKGIYQGECDIAILNSYYMGAMLDDAEQTEWANSVRLIFPNQSNRGTHVNISGVALTQASKHTDNAIKLMEFLSSDVAQKYYAEVNHEYPVKAGVAASELVSSWGEFKHDELPLAEIASYFNDASRLVDEVAYDQ